MLDGTQAWIDFMEYSMALGTVLGAMAWFRKDSAEDDGMVADSCRIVLDTLSDADKTRAIESHTEKNLRDQISVEEAIEMDREEKLRRFGWSRN